VQAEAWFPSVEVLFSMEVVSVCRCGVYVCGVYSACADYLEMAQGCSDACSTTMSWIPPTSR
jgi:hypothetical protein